MTKCRFWFEDWGPLNYMLSNLCWICLYFLTISPVAGWERDWFVTWCPMVCTGLQIGHSQTTMWCQTNENAVLSDVWSLQGCNARVNWCRHETLWWPMVTFVMTRAEHRAGPHTASSDSWPTYHWHTTHCLDKHIGYTHTTACPTSSYQQTWKILEGIW